MADVIITITAVDKASPVVKKIGDAAKKAAADLQKAGADGKKGLQDIENGATGADSKLRTFERTSLAVGAAVGALGLGLVRVSAAWKQQERQIDAVNRLYGEAGSELLQYAESIQLVTRYSNDAARESLVLLNTLTANYGYSQDQIESLLMRSADLAQLHGRTLTETTQMIANALRGEGEYIEQIGVTMNQTFVAAEAARRGLGNFISDMTAAEQAAFRFVVLMEQTAAAQGYAMEAAAGSAGAAALLMNEVQDLGQAFGSLLGPVGEVAAQFNAYALWLPLIASQTARVSAILINATRNQTLFANGLAATAVKAGVFGVIAGSLIVTVGLLAGAWLRSKRESEQLQIAWDNVAASAANLDQVITGLFLSGENNAAKWASGIRDEFNTVIEAFDAMSEKPEELDKAWSEFVKDFPEFDFEDQFQNRFGNEKFLDFIEVNPEDLDRIQKSMADIFNLMSNPYIDRDAMRADFQQLFDETMAGIADYSIDPDDVDAIFAEFYQKWAQSAQKTEERISNLEFDFHIDDLLARGQRDAAEAAIELDSMFDDVIGAFDDFQAHLENTNLYDSFLIAMGGTGARNPFEDFSETQLKELEMFQDRFQRILESGNYENSTILRILGQLRSEYMSGAMSAEEYLLALGDIATMTHLWANEAENAAFRAKDFAGSLQGLASGATEAANEIRDAFAENMAGFIDSYLEAFNMNDPVSLLNLSSLRSEFTALAGDIMNASSQMETVFRVIVGNTEAIKSQAQSIHDWIDGLADVEDGVRRIDSLLADGLINQGQYDAAIQAHDDIANAQIRIANNIDAIQAKQAPFIAQFVEQQAVALEALNGQSEVQQRITLGWMDSTTAAQAYQVIQMAVAVGNGELGRSGEAAFEQFIRGAAASSPFLFDMWESIGLINGTPLDFEVDYSAVTDGMSEIEMLTLRIEDLVVALGGTLTPIDIEVNGEEEVTSAEEAIRNFIGNGVKDFVIKIKTTLTGDDGSPLGGAGKSLADLARRLIGGDSGGDGTGGAVNIPVEFDYPDMEADLSVFDEVTIPVKYEVEEPDIQNAFDDVTIKVNFEADPSSLAVEMLTYSGQRVQGPTFVFQPDMGAMGEIVYQFMGAEYNGPTFTFLPNSSEVLARAGEVWSTTYSGPTFNFIADSANLSAIVGQYRDLRVGGPTFNFQPDTASLSAIVAQYRDLNVSGPTFAFQANVSALTGAIQAYAGKTVGTAYINVEARMVGSIPGTRHGGVPHRASGGILTYLAEDNNPETLHFANGGSTVIRDEGLYSVPPSTLVVPSNNDRSPGSGVTVVLNTGDFYGGSRPDLDEWASDTLVPVFARELKRIYSSAGS